MLTSRPPRLQKDMLNTLLFSFTQFMFLGFVIGLQQNVKKLDMWVAKGDANLSFQCTAILQTALQKKPESELECCIHRLFLLIFIIMLSN